MALEATHDVIRRISKATLDKTLVWQEESDGWYSTVISIRTISCRFLYFEATNQAGADRYAIQLSMPGINKTFACGTLGYELLFETLSAALQWNVGDPGFASRFLDDSGL